MPMMVSFNESSHFALQQANKNSALADNALARLASGEKFTGPQDDSGSYAISERMREQIRSLSQDTQNTQNGSSMLKTAERGVSQIVDNLRSMKELAVDSANDSNTDEDRQTLQKEFAQRMDTINELVYATRYNGKILLDGRYDRPKFGEATVKNLVDAFKASYNATEDSTVQLSGATTTPAAWRFQIDKNFTKPNNSDPDFSVEIDFSAMETEGGSFLESLHGQGFSILCGGCPQYLNILFNANKTATESTYNRTANSLGGVVNDMAREFVIGVKDVKTSEDLAETIFQGISAVSSSIEGSFTTSMSGTTLTKTATKGNTADDILINAAHNLRIRRDPNDSSKILFTKDSLAMQFRNGIIKNPDLDELEDLNKRTTGPLWIQHGISSGQHSNFYIADMQTRALGTGQLFDGGELVKESDIARYNALNDNTTKQTEWVNFLKKAENKTVDDISVTTVENANVAIRVLDGALDYALNEATHLGAYLQRLEHTDANIATMSENAQSSDSILRDADMAKEMTNYAKYNLLTQSAQAMLAQANQTPSTVISLLQQKGED